MELTGPETGELRWILDDGPLDQLARFADPATLTRGAAGSLLVASTTARAAAVSERRRALLELDCADGRLVEEFSVEIGDDDPAAEILLELHGSENTRLDLAEREAISWAQVHGASAGGQAVFVTSDQRATVTALAELGRGRVAHPFDLWLDLLRQGRIGRSQFEKLCEATRNKDQGLERMPTRVRLPDAGGGGSRSAP